MKVKIYKRVEKWRPVSSHKWFTTREAAYNYGRNEEWGPPLEVEVTLSAAGLVRFLNREM